MKIFAPDYYNYFKCIADRCKHSCCIGWEIDIDDDTFEYYECIDSDFGKRLRANIVRQDDCNCFKLTENERCPFLNDNNLCDIILNLSEDALCQICSDHPRFRNFYSDRIEVGLGLCCEEAARLILTKQDKTKMVEFDNDELADELNDFEKTFFDKRNKYFEYFQNRELPIKERMSLDNNHYSKDILQKYLSLEILDDSWKALISQLTEHYDDIANIQLSSKFDICFEQLLVYFIYRHFALLIDRINEKSLLNFIKLSANIVYSLCQLHIYKHKELNISDICEYARMYSSEIEYSQENLDALIP